LVNAVNVSLLLNQPLLLTGEPGTGKSQLAYSLAWELGMGDPLKFRTKSTSTARDLFYTYDALGRFHAAQSVAAPAGPGQYLKLQALGLAMALSNTYSPRDLLPPQYANQAPRRSVVLIDEIDKAPRDFPNDILNELEDNRFLISELDNLEISADPDLPPILIITSNSEKDLPDAFLRRCAFYNVPFPDRAGLARIVALRLGEYAGGSSQFLDDALEIFDLLRRSSNSLRKPPATAEFLGWLAALRNASPDAANPLREPGVAMCTVGVLIKTAEDQDHATQVMTRWSEKNGVTAPRQEA
jgi:MoxR-like ATPase